MISTHWLRICGTKVLSLSAPHSHHSDNLKLELSTSSPFYFLQKSETLIPHNTILYSLPTITHFTTKHHKSCPASQLTQPPVCPDYNSPKYTTHREPLVNNRSTPEQAAQLLTAIWNSPYNIDCQNWQTQIDSDKANTDAQKAKEEEEKKKLQTRREWKTKRRKGKRINQNTSLFQNDQSLHSNLSSPALSH